MSGKNTRSLYFDCPSYKVVNGVVTRSNIMPTFQPNTSISQRGLRYNFHNFNDLVNANLKGIVSVGAGGLYFGFMGCDNLETIDLSDVQTCGEQGFQYMCYNNPKLNNINLSSLQQAGKNAFQYCFGGTSALNSITFTSLSNITNQCFYAAFYSSLIKHLYFPALTSSSFNGYTNVFVYMLYLVDGCTVHFPAALQSTIGNWSDVSSGFGGTNTTVLFDL